MRRTVPHCLLFPIVGLLSACDPPPSFVRVQAILEEAVARRFVPSGHVALVAAMHIRYHQLSPVPFFEGEVEQSESVVRAGVWCEGDAAFLFGSAHVGLQHRIDGVDVEWWLEPVGPEARCGLAPWAPTTRPTRPPDVVNTDAEMYRPTPTVGQAFVRIGQGVAATTPPASRAPAAMAP